MSKLKLTLAIGLIGALGCSSSSNNAPDSGTKPDGGDASASETGGDAAAGDTAPDAAAGDTAATDGGASDAVVLTPLQARGKYLVNNVVACGDCHTPRKADGSPDFTKFLAGNAAFIVTPGGDKLPTRNLTNDATGLKNRTDAEIKAMFMDGKRPTATGMEALNPVMPYYVFHNMTSADGDAIVAYLRTVPGVNNEIPRRSAAFDVAAPANYLDPNKIPLPLDTYAQRESALRGRYLAAESGLCVECHTQHQMAADVINPAKLFQGGEDFSNFFAATLMIHPVSKNLTSDPTTGLGNWTVADVVKVLKEGKAKDGTGICPPMPTGPMGAYGGLSDDDANDIANYIKSLPPAVNAVPDMCVFPPVAPGDGGAGDGGGSDGGASDGAASDASASEAGSDAAAAGDASGN
jgi:mono/diheme cytochrome c family protein